MPKFPFWVDMSLFMILDIEAETLEEAAEQVSFMEDDQIFEVLNVFNGIKLENGVELQINQVAIAEDHNAEN